MMEFTGAACVVSYLVGTTLQIEVYEAPNWNELPVGSELRVRLAVDLLLLPFLVRLFDRSWLRQVISSQVYMRRRNGIYL